jgi:hypothetical protein
MAVADKVAGVALSAGALLPSLLTNDLTTPVIGVVVTTVAGSILGTYAAIGYDDARRPRGQLFLLASSTVIVGAAAAGVVPKFMGWAWSSGGTEAGAAALFAFTAYYALPPAIKRAVQLIREFKLSDLLPWRKGAAVTPGPDNAPAAPPPAGDPEK